MHRLASPHRTVVSALREERASLETWFPDAPFAGYHEGHLAHALAAALAENGAQRVVIRPPCDGHGRDHCDLWAHWDDGDVQVELRRGHWGSGAGGSAKPQGRLRAWLGDVARLRRAGERDGKRVFALVHSRAAPLELPGSRERDPALSKLADRLAQAIRRGRGVDRVPLPRLAPPDAIGVLEAVLARLGDAVAEDDEVEGPGFEPRERLRYRYVAATLA